MVESFQPDPASASEEERLETLRQKILSRKGVISAFCRKMLTKYQRPNDVDDVVNRVLYKAHKNAGQFRAEANLDTWLLSIARNTTLSYIRGLKKVKDETQKTINIDLEKMVDTRTTEEHLIEQEQEQIQKKALAEAIEKLDAVDRKVIEVSFIEGLTEQERSETTGMAINAYKTRLHRARRKLAKLLGKEDNIKI